mgnify:CR=1 FL=1
MRIQRPIFAVCALLTVVLSVSFLAWPSGGRAQTPAAPPLSLEGLLGDDEKLSDSSKKADDLKADNFICLVCRGNFEEEDLVVTHAKEDVGCADCHGASVAHADDEDHVIPPEKMYDPEDVDKMCSACHDEHDAPARDVLARWQQRCPGKTDPSTIHCTDCHFEHRMSKRTVWWDRDTGKLVIRKEGQTTKTSDPSDGSTESSP